MNLARSIGDIACGELLLLSIIRRWSWVIKQRTAASETVLGFRLLLIKKLTQTEPTVKTYARAGTAVTRAPRCWHRQTELPGRLHSEVITTFLRYTKRQGHFGTLLKAQLKYITITIHSHTHKKETPWTGFHAY